MKSPFPLGGKRATAEMRDTNPHSRLALLLIGVHRLHSSAVPPLLPRPWRVVTGCSGIGRCPGTHALRHVGCVVAALLFAESYTEYTEFSHSTLNSV